MALVPGSCAIGGNLVVSAPSVPAVLQPMAQPPIDSGSANAEMAAGGAWDLKAWEKDNDSVDASSCICVSVGRELYASVWEPKTRVPVHVPFGADCNDEVTVSSGNSLQTVARPSSDSLQAVVTFNEPASTRRIRKWLDPDSRSRLYATLPSGVSVGANCPHSDGVDLEIRPARLLGLHGKCHEFSDEFFQSQARHGNMSAQPVVSDTDDSVFTKVDVQLRLQRNREKEGGQGEDEEEALLDPEDIFSLIIARIRRAYSEANDGDLKSYVAFSVPSWWGDMRRSSVASAASRAGVMPSRTASSPLCTVIGLYSRLVQSEASSDYHALNCGTPVLVVSEDLDFIDVMLLQASESNGESQSDDGNNRIAPSWQAMSAGVGGLQGVCTVALAIHDVIRDSSVQDISAIVLVGEVNLEVVLSAIANATKKPDDFFKSLPVIQANGNDTADGLTYLIASELACDENEETHMPSVIDVCSESVSLIIHPIGNNAVVDKAGVEHEIIVHRGQELPAIGRYIFKRTSADKVAVDFDVEIRCSQNHDVSSSLWHQHSRFSSVLTLEAEDGQTYPCESAVLVATVNKNGTLTVAIEDISSSSYDEASNKRSKRRFFIMIFLALLLALSMLARWGNISEGTSSAGSFSKKAFRPRLESFLRQHNPSKLKEVDNWLRKYDGREKSLVDMLEKKYGSRFPLNSAEL